jgi:hypothetical protein
MLIANLSQYFNSQGECLVHETNHSLEILNHNKEQIAVQNLMTGKEFLKQVNRCYLNDNNCKLASIMLEGYRSNLGLQYKGINQGEQCMTKRQFKKIFKLFNTIVLWNNVEGAENE